MLISQVEASKILGISRVAINKWKNRKIVPSFMVQDGKGVYKIDDEHPEWLVRLAKVGNKAKDHQNDKRSKGQKDKKLKENPVDGKPEKDKPVFTNPVLKKLGERALIAELEGTIFGAKIKEEKSKQEEIKTLEVKKDLAPIDLVKHFFSFSESLIQRIYRKPNEIEPQLAALFLAGENKKATQLIVRELETIVIDSQKQLIKSIEDEGFKTKKLK